MNDTTLESGNDGTGDKASALTEEKGVENGHQTAALPSLLSEEYIAKLENRLKLLETRDQRPEETKPDSNSQEPTSKVSIPLPCTLTRVPISSWPTRDDDEDPSVLVVYQTDRTGSTGQYRNLENYHEVNSNIPMEHGLNLEPDARFVGARPDRLRLNSADLLSTLKEITGHTSSIAKTYIWPFKYLFSYEKEIHDCYKRADERLELAERASNSILGTQVIKKSHVNEEDNAKIRDTAEKLEASEELRDSASHEKEKIDKESRLRDELHCLTTFMDHDLRDVFSVRNELLEGTLKTIPFEYLWFLFTPGDTIVSKVSPKQMYRVVHVTGGRPVLDIRETRENAHSIRRARKALEDGGLPSITSKISPFTIDAFRIGFDGHKLYPMPKVFTIYSYQSERLITSLEVYPTRFDERSEELKKTLIERGKRFIEVVKTPHKKYSGLTVTDPPVRDYQEEVNSDIIIDVALAVKHLRLDHFARTDYMGNAYEFGFEAGILESPTIADIKEVTEAVICGVVGCTSCRSRDIYDDAACDLRARNNFLASTSLIRFHKVDSDFSHEFLALLPPCVYGYALLDRKFYMFNVDLIENITEADTTGFDDLVLPKYHKKLMQALVKNHTRDSKSTFDADNHDAKSDFSMDLVRGKGKGLIILLHGVPGVGKTSTAECVAAQTKRPLFPITCGDIGTYASDVEEKLSNYFELAHKWGCVLLLDEADVYLASREKGGDLTRNALVSVFLRVLEYYSGILILTTNRVGQFDEAIKSRIHISLYYPKLDEDLTGKIWKMNIRRVQTSGLDIELDEKAIIKFSKKHWLKGNERPSRRWNGRQIKNAFQTGIALAHWDFAHEKQDARGPRPLLTDKHFSVVAQTSAHFDDYISKMHNVEDEDTWAVVAQREQFREDSVSLTSPQGSRRAVNKRTGKRKGQEPDESGWGGIGDESEEENADSDDADREEEISLSKSEALKLEKLLKSMKNNAAGRHRGADDERSIARERQRRRKGPETIAEEKDLSEDDDGFL